MHRELFFLTKYAKIQKYKMKDYSTFKNAKYKANSWTKRANRANRAAET